jgi:hypothetical protein
MIMNNLLPHKNLSLDDMEGEIWKDIEGYEGFYQISNFGRVKSLSRLIVNRFSNRITIDIIRKPVVSKDGYTYVKISFNKKSTKYSIHRLVALNFIDNPNSKLEVNHIDSIRLNNNVKNLEWVSKSENQCHSKINKKTTSKYAGVTFNKNFKANAWISQIGINNKNIYLGVYKTEEEAYQARCDYEKKNKIENKYL